jgi:molecular chaperone GrpE
MKDDSHKDDIIDDAADDIVVDAAENAGGIESDEEFVPEDGEGNTATTKDTVKQLREQLKKAVAEKQEYLDGWQRSKADFINARKRDEESRKELVKYATEEVLTDLIPVLDSFTMAFSNKEAWEKVDKNWRMGVEYISSQLQNVLDAHGLVAFDPMGESFDPTKHNAVETIAVTDKAQDHRVLSVLQKGYTLQGKIVRAANVKIGELKKD